jgi:hypothetical protein
MRAFSPGGRSNFPAILSGTLLAGRAQNNQGSLQLSLKLIVLA